MRSVLVAVMMCVLPLAFAGAAGAAEEQAVVVHLKLSGSGFGTEAERKSLFELEKAVESAINHSSTGEYDGNEVGGGEFVMFCYGPNADALFATIERLLRQSPLAKGATVIIRYGKPGAKQREVNL